MSIFKRLFGRNQAPDNTAQPTPDTSTMLAGDYRFIAVDVETANANQHSICQVGLAMVAQDGSIKTLGHLINPGEKFDKFNVNLHGIDAATVKDAIGFGDYITLTRTLLERHTLIQHSNFDKQAFNAACAQLGIAEINAEWVDSVRIARAAWPELIGNGGHGLANLKQHLGLIFDHHNAVEDARAAAQVVLCAEAETGKDFMDILPKKTAKPRFQTNTPTEGNPDGPLHGQPMGQLRPQDH